MGGFEVEPDAVTDAGNALVKIAESLAQAGDPLAGLGDLADPPLTAAALRSLAAEWPVGTERLAGDVRSLGQAAQGAAFLYTLTDEHVIPVTAP